MKVKKILTKKLFGTIPVFLLIALIAVGGASAAFLSYYGTITGMATVDQSVLVDGQPKADGTIPATYDTSFTAGKTFIEKHYLENTADVEAKMYFKTGYKTDEESSLSDSEPGITTKVVEYFDDAGATIPDYKAPATEDCDITVSDYSTLVEKVDGDDTNDASTGATVCVKNGTYTGQITIGVKDLTLVAKNKGRAVIDGSGVTLSDAPSDQGWNSLVAITADDVTFKGFKVTNSKDRGIGTSKDLSNIVLNHNTVTNNAAGGIQAGGGSKVTVKNNKVRNNGWDGFVAYGLGTSTIKNNIFSSNRPSGVHGVVWHDSGIEVGLTGSASVTISGNIIKDNVGDDSSEEGSSVGAGIYLRDSIDSDNSVTIKSNDITGNSDYGIASKADASGISVSNNNIVDNGLGVQHTGAGTLDATNNWWGTDGISTSGNVEATWKNKTESNDNDGDTGSFTLGAGKTDHFGIINDFAIDLKPLDYIITTKVKPGTPTE